MYFSEASVFCGGDLAGVAETAVEAVNDGKVYPQTFWYPKKVIAYLWFLYLLSLKKGYFKINYRYVFLGIFSRNVELDH